MDSKPLEARCRRDPKDPLRGWLDKEAKLGRGASGLIVGYKVHLACDGEEDMPLAGVERKRIPEFAKTRLISNSRL